MRYYEQDGLKVSQIGVGCYGLSGAYGAKDRAELARVLRRAGELGVTFFDTASAYGDAEEFLGNVIRDFRDDVCLATKVGLAGQGATSDLSPQAIRASCELSLKRLGTDYIDLYQVHYDDPHAAVGEVVGAFESLKAAGKIRAWGVSHLPPDRVREYCTVGRPFSVMMELSAAARDAVRTRLPICKECGAVAIAFSVTARGLLTGAIKRGHTFEPGDIRSYDPLFQREQFESGLRVAARLAALAERHSKTPAQVGIAWALSQPQVVCALTGPSAVSHLEENLGAADWRLPQDDLDDLRAVLDSEDHWLAQEQLKSVCAILEGELSPDIEKTFADLVYVLETAVALSALTEEVVVPMFGGLVAAREKCGSPGLDDMTRLRQQLREAFSCSGQSPVRVAVAPQTACE